MISKNAIDITDVFNILILLKGDKSSTSIEHSDFFPSVMTSRAQQGEGTITETAVTSTACITPSIKCHYNSSTTVLLYNKIYILYLKIPVSCTATFIFQYVSSVAATTLKL